MTSEETSLDLIRILLADDHPAMLTGLKQTLTQQPNFLIVDEICDSQQLVARCHLCKPDILLLDLDMPGGPPAYALVRQLHQELPQLKIVIFTAFSYGTYLDLIAYGIVGYVLKTTPLDTLCDLLRLVVEGGVWFDPVVLGKYQRRKQTMANLTEREQEVIQQLVKGCSNIQISQELSISERTVRHHLNQLFNKLPVKSRSQLILWAIEQQIVEL